MRIQPTGKVSIALHTALAFAFLTASLWQSTGSAEGRATAEGKKEFKGAIVQGDKLVLKPGFKLRKVSETRVETFKEEPAAAAPSGTPTARRVSKPIATDGINIKCVCSGSGKCAVTIALDSAFCTSVSCGSKEICALVATEQP